MASEPRSFKNKFPDYDGSKTVLDSSSQMLKREVEEPLRVNISLLLQKLENGLNKEVDWHDHSVYTGTSGIALLYLHLMDVFDYGQKEAFLQKALPYAEKCIPHLKKRRFSFMCGDPGPLAIAAVLYHRKGMEQESKNLLNSLQKLHPEVVRMDTDLPDELLYGRSGYLFSLLFVQKHLGKNAIQEEVIKRVVTSILKSGQHLSTRLQHRSLLMYEWHDKPYVGAAHGLTGILYMLLQAKDYLVSAEVHNFVKPSIDYVLSLKFPSGNYPSSLGNSSDKLIHWCHGAPGVIHLMTLAYQVFREDKYLSSAKECAEEIWKRGLLTKGYGICHGVAGNAYAFLRMFQLTKDEKYLYRAVKFAEWCYDYGKHGCRIADRPLSLFEGLAGTLYFLADLLNPFHTAFPAFQLF